MAEVAVGERLADVAALAADGWLLAVDEKRHELLVLQWDAGALRIAERIPVSRYPVSLAVSPDGSFQLSTYKSGDGLLAGKHRVAVVEYSPKEPPPPPKVDRAFSSVEGSGLEINVERPTSDIVLKVRHAPPRPRR